MYVNEKLKLNKFRYVKCMTKKELFANVGNITQNQDAYTGDEVSKMAQTKTEQLAAAETMIQHTRAKATESEPNSPE